MINYAIPLVILFIIIYGIYKKVDIFDVFISGVKEGLDMCLNLFPTIFAMIISINVFINSNIIIYINRIISPLLNKVGFPYQVLPLCLLKPISGSASLTLLNDILSKHHPDTFIGRLSSIIAGSTDTTIYIIGMYFGSIGIKKVRYALIVGLLADFISIILAFIILKLN